MKDNARALSARAFSVGMALTCASWVVLGLSQSPAADRWTPVRLGLALLHATVAILFALRIPAKAEGSVADLIAALPSLILSGVLFRLSPPPSTWPWWLSGLFAGGAVFAAGSLAVLGRSFAFMPARRDLVTTGPYRLVRHPAYLGELSMTFALLLAVVIQPNRDATHAAMAAGCFAVLVPTLAWRILVEERIMQKASGWSVFVDATPSRLIPGVW